MGRDDEVQERLRLAVEAAERGDTRTFFLELAASHALDGVFKALRRNWPRVEEGAIEAIVAEAADALYEKLAVDHGVVGNAGAYLWGTARNMLSKRHDAGVLDTVPLDDLIGVTVEPPGVDAEGPDEDELRAEALRRARAYLPRLGQEVVRQVMAFIFDGVERGDVFLDNATIGAALGLTSSTVRRSKSRGFQRLKEAAEQEGIDMSGVLEANTADEEDGED